MNENMGDLLGCVKDIMPQYRAKKGAKMNAILEPVKGEVTVRTASSVAFYMICWAE